MTGCEDGKEREQRTGPTRCLFFTGHTIAFDSEQKNSN